MSRMESVRKGDLLLHDDIQFGSSPHIIHATPPDLAPASPFSEVSVGASGEGGLYYLNAAELAAIESKKTREKLKNKAERVENFHRKVVKRVAAERRTADAAAGRRKPRHMYPTAGSGIATQGLLVHGEDPSLWPASFSQNEALHYHQPVRVKGERGDVASLLNADIEARRALAAYRVSSDAETGQG